MKQFEELCEHFGVIKKTVKIMYPRQIKFSESFLNTLKQEYFKQKLEEDSTNPLKDRPDKFIKGIKFHLMDFENNAQSEMEAYKRIMDENTDEFVAMDPKKTKAPAVKVCPKKMKNEKEAVLKRNTTSTSSQQKVR